MEILLWFGILLVSLTVLVLSADYFTESAEKIGLYFGLSSFIVGATIVSIGSSLPELATSFITILSGDPNQTSFPIDNIIGSNIANCLLVGGLAAIAVKTLKVKQQLIDVDLPFFFISTALFLLFISDRVFDWKEAIISLLLLGIFIVYTINTEDDEEEKKSSEKNLKSKKEKLTFSVFAILIAGVLGIYFSADYTVTSVLKLADLLGIESSVITLLAVAIGTSLPEIIISTRAALKGNHSVALGNIFGSNTFNVLAVAGIPAFVGNLTVSDKAFTYGIPFLAVTSLAFIFVTTDDKIKNWEGAALLVIYVAFTGKILGVL